jgi:hypothetical protein
MFVTVVESVNVTSKNPDVVLMLEFDGLAVIVFVADTAVAMTATHTSARNSFFMGSVLAVLEGCSFSNRQTAVTTFSLIFILFFKILWLTRSGSIGPAARLLMIVSAYDFVSEWGSLAE